VAVARANEIAEIEVQYQQSNSFRGLMDLYILRRFLSYFLLLSDVHLFVGRSLSSNFSTTSRATEFHFLSS